MVKFNLLKIACLWLMAFIRGDLKLPRGEDQVKELERVYKWTCENIAMESATSNAVSTRSLHYFEELLNDLGISCWRKPILLDYFVRYTPTDYKHVVNEIFDKKK